MEGIKKFFVFLIILSLFSSCHKKEERKAKRDTTPPVTTAYPPGGTYYYPITVTLTTSEPATIYYGIDDVIPSIGDPNTKVAKNSVKIYIDHSTSLRYFSVDLAGNVETLKKQEYIIAKPPAEAVLNCEFTDPASDLYINSSHLPYVVRGRAWAKNTVVRVVKISPDGGATWYKAAGTTNWSFQFDPDREGDYYFLCKAGNGLNLEMLGTSSVHIIVDNTPPVVNPDSNSIVVNAENNPTWFTGTASDSPPGVIDRVEISPDGILWIRVMETNRWEYPFMVSYGIEKPVSTWFVRAVDRAGNVSEEKSFSLKIDSRLPEIFVNSPNDITYTFADEENFSIDFSEEVTGGIYRYDDVSETWEKVVNFEGVTSLDRYLPVRDGVNFFNIVVRDEAGNIAAKSLIVIRSGIVIPGRKYALFRDNRFYLSPVSVVTGFYGDEYGSYYILTGDFYSPVTSFASYSYSLTYPVLWDNNLSTTGDVVGGIVHNASGGKLVIAAYSNYKFGDNITESVFYGVPVTRIIINENGGDVGYSLRIPSDILSKGVALFAFEDKNGDGFLQCSERAGYHNGGVFAAGSYDITLFDQEPGSPDIFIDGKRVEGSENNPVDLSPYSDNTTIAVYNTGCGGGVKFSFWIDDNSNGIIDNGERYVLRYMVDGIESEGDLDGVSDGKVVTTVGEVFKNMEFDKTPLVVSSRGGEKILYVKRQKAHPINFTLTVTDVADGSPVSGKKILILTEMEGVLSTTDNNGTAAFSIENGDNGFVPFILSGKYVLEGEKSSLPASITDGMNVRIGARVTDVTVRGKVVAGGPVKSGFITAISGCGAYGQTAIASIDEGFFSLNLTSFKPQSPLPVRWSLQVYPYDYNVEVTLSPESITIPAGRGIINLGEMKVGQYTFPGISFRDFAGKIAVVKSVEGKFIYREYTEKNLFQGRYWKVFFGDGGEFSLYDVEVTEEVILPFPAVSSSSGYNISGRIYNPAFGEVAYYFLMEDPEESVDLIFETDSRGFFSYSLPAGEWRMRWGTSIESLFNPEEFNSALIELSDDTDFGSRSFYIKSYVTVGYSFPRDWEGDRVTVSMKNLLTGFTYSQSVTTTSGYLTFFNLIPGSYLLFAVHSGNIYYYPDGVVDYSLAQPVETGIEGFWKKVDFVVNQ